MIAKRLFLVVLLSQALPVWSWMVSIQLMETGIDREIASGDYPFLLEGGLMAALFDAGHIVTSGSVIRISGETAADLQEYQQEALYNAVDSGSDYCIFAIIEYTLHAGRAIPVQITLSVYDARTEQALHTQVFSVGAGMEDEAFRLAQNAGQSVLRQLRGR